MHSYILHFDFISSSSEVHLVSIFCVCSVSILELVQRYTIYPSCKVTKVLMSNTTAEQKQQ